MPTKPSARRVLALLLVALSCNDAFAQAPADPTGVWMTEDGAARVRIEHCPRARAGICGYVVWSRGEDGSGRDLNNPDAARRDRPLLGVQIMLGLKATGAGYGGRLYNAQDGKTYDATIKREDDGRLTLRGCVLKYLCRSQSWTKVDDAAGGQLVGPIDQLGGPRTDAEFGRARSRRPSGQP